MKKIYTLLIVASAALFCSGQTSDTLVPDTLPGCQVYFTTELDIPISDSLSDSYAYRFTGKSDAEVVSWKWDFGDGTTGLDREIIHYYTHRGDTVHVCLTILTADGCESTYCEIMVISDWMPPVECPIDFEIQVYKSLPPQYRFVPDRKDSLGSYYWDFGDGTNSFEMTPVHIYEVTGTYTVNLFFTSSEYCSSYAMHLVEATGTSLCKAYWTAYPAAYPVEPKFPPSDCTVVITSSTFFFLDQSLGNIISRKWDFGDGNTSSEIFPVHHYQAAGTYTVCLEVLTADGCTSTYCSDIYVQGPLDCNLTGTVKDYTGLDGCGLLIELDNGVVLEPAEMVPNFVIYDGQRVRLSYTELKDRASICMAGVIARIDCISEIQDDSCGAEFTYYALPWVSSVPPIYQFDMIFPNVNIASVIWDFGDGTVTNEFAPSHRFPYDGYYNICLTVNTLQGCTATVCQTDYFDGYDPQPGLCDTYIRLVTDVILNGQTCNGSATASLVDIYGNNVTVGEYLWSTGETGPVIFNLCPGYTYSVIITNSGGCAVSGSFSYGNPQTYPDSLIGYWKYEQDDLDFMFNLPLFSDSVYCEWDFGDGARAEGATVNHTYEEAINYTVTLNVFDNKGNLLYNQEILVSPGAPTGIKQPETGSPVVYPVPAADQLFITLPSEELQVSKLEILNAGGHTLMITTPVNQTDKKIEISVSGLPPGFYIGKLSYQNGKMQTFRFVK